MTSRDPELAELQKKARRMELQLEIARTEKAIAELNKPELPMPASLPQPAAETREQKRAKLAAREKQVREEIRITEADPTLSEEQKMRKLNGLEAKLAEIHEEQTALL
jgi:hypothetical protein